MRIVNEIQAGLSRRGFARALAGAALARLCAGAERPEQCSERQYRADAHVLLLGIPLVHRSGVGGGSVVWTESETSGITRHLEFRGYSLPARAAGVNRLGFIRETVRASDSGAVEAEYFGLMTSSPEESADEARKALQSTAKEQTYSTIDGWIAPGRSQTLTAHFTAPANISGENRSELEQRARRALSSADKPSATPVAPEDARPFLQALADLLLRPERAEGSFTYSGRPYRLQLTRSVDRKATAYFRERRLIAEGAEVIRVSGKVQRKSGGKETEFRLWIQAGADRPLPLRIEYQAKSYLRLVFEVVA
jgi:hypothetical protein